MPNVNSKAGARRKHSKKEAAKDEWVIEDINLVAAGLLYDMAALQPTERSRFGYKRAAKAIIFLPMPVTELVSAEALREIPFVGPASARIVTEVVELGKSPTVENAVAKAGKTSVVAKVRQFRDGYLSHFVLSQALGADMPEWIVGKASYRGDFQMHSTWSDGGEKIGTMAEAAMDLGHTCLGMPRSNGQRSTG